MLGAIGLKQVIDQIGGKVVVLGCPAEEGGENGSATSRCQKNLNKLIRSGQAGGSVGSALISTS